MGVCGIVLAVLLSAGPSATVSADPPCWAQAHGHHAKHRDKKCDKRHTHHEHEHVQTRHEFPAQHDGGSDGSAVSVGGLLGAAIGGYAGSHIGSGKGKLAATAGGAAAGYLVGQEVEKE